MAESAAHSIVQNAAVSTSLKHQSFEKRLNTCENGRNELREQMGLLMSRAAEDSEAMALLSQALFIEVHCHYMYCSTRLISMLLLQASLASAIAGDEAKSELDILKRRFETESVSRSKAHSPSMRATSIMVAGPGPGPESQTLSPLKGRIEAQEGAVQHLMEVLFSYHSIRVRVRHLMEVFFSYRSFKPKCLISFKPKCLISFKPKCLKVCLKSSIFDSGCRRPG